MRDNTGSGRGLFGDAQPGPPAARIPLRSRSALVLLVLMPACYGLMLASSWAVISELVLGQSFGLSGGRPAPWPGDVALVWLTAFWLATIVDRTRMAPRLGQVVLIVGWFATFIAWATLEPAYDGNMLLSDPGALVTDDGYLIPPLLISLVVWWFGMQLARDISLASPEEFRGIAQRSWIVLGFSLVLATWIDGDTGGRALSLARFAVPGLAIASLALIAGAEVQATRRLALRRGGQPPDWDRWLRLVAGVTVFVVAVTALVLVILSPGAISALIAGLLVILTLLGWAARYVFLALIFVAYQVILGITWIIESLFGRVFTPPELPQQLQLQGAPAEQLPEQQEPSAIPYATEIRWILLVLTVLILALVIFRLTRRFGARETEDPLDESRDNVFSADLARRQLRDLFRRRPRPSRIAPLDLATTPRSVRETMQYLQTLAARQDASRAEDESADDFIRRLRAVWPGLGQPLGDLVRRYEFVRYGDESRNGDPDEVRETGTAWTRIWSARKDVPPPTPPPEPET